jgi:hypothetical protein
MQDLIDRISKLVKQGKTDRQISQMIGKSTSRIYAIRTQILKVSIPVKKCPNCKQSKNTICFSSKHDGGPYEGWCIQCRRRAGIDIYTLQRIKRYGKKKQTKVYECLKCEELFESEVWGPNNNNHFYTCPHCRFFITQTDRVSI